jgi:arabinogalactan endo-1,4-beta-galactosidase
LFACLLAISALQLASAQARFLHGGDVSEIPEVEAKGVHFSYLGKVEDPFRIMKKAGWNFIRLRVWNNPKDGFCDVSHTLAMAKRAKAAGLKVGIDFHYSDYWADPGHQNKPAAWRSLSFPQLTDAVYVFTKSTVQALVNQGTRPAIVQIGNEIGAGMLWPDGKIESADPAQWQRLSTLIKAGLRGVKDGQGGQHIATMIHLERGGDNGGARWWFDHLTPYNVDFDVIGLSYYPFWHGHLDAFKRNVNDLAERYGKDIYVAEVAYPWTTSHKGHFAEVLSKLEPGYPATPKGQADFLAYVIKTVKEIPQGHGAGILYWAPFWISAPGKDVAWDTLATFNEAGESLPAVSVLGGH